MNNWFEYIVYHMRTQPQRPALLMENRVVTYGMLRTGIERCAHRIARLNVAQGEPIGVLYGDPIRHLTLCLALYRVGIASLSLIGAHAGLKSWQAGAVLCDAEAKKMNFAGVRAIEVAEDWFTGDDVPVALPRSFADRGEICRLSLTSGTTGEAKLVAFSPERIGRRFQFYLFSSWHRVLILPGLSTIFGFLPACAALATGRTACFAQSPFQAMRVIALFSVDLAIAATEQLVALTRVARKVNASLDTLRTVHVCGSMPTQAMLQAATVHVCRDIVNRYAMTELGTMARAGAQAILQQPGLAGQIEPGIEVAILDENGDRCPDGQAGRVKARYDDGDEDWVDVGDIGWIAPENQLYIVGRSADGAISRQLSPVYELEHLLRLEWDMSDAGAVLMESGARGKPEIWIGTVDCKDATAEKLEAIARARGIDCNVKLFALNAIPRTANGKINRSRLKEVLLAADGGNA